MEANMIVASKEHKNKSNTSLFALFEKKSQLENAVKQLKQAGFAQNDISILLSNSSFDSEIRLENATKAPEGAFSGGAIGLVIGVALGWLTGVGILQIPGAGFFISAGPLMAAVAGAGIGGTLGGMTGALVGLGIPEYEAKRYVGFVKGGGQLLSVHIDDEVLQTKANKILKSCNARSIAVQSEVNSNDDSSDDTYPKIPPENPLPFNYSPPMI